MTKPKKQRKARSFTTVSTSAALYSPPFSSYLSLAPDTVTLTMELVYKAGGKMLRKKLVAKGSLEDVRAQIKDWDL